MTSASILSGRCHGALTNNNNSYRCNHGNSYSYSHSNSNRNRIKKSDSKSNSNGNTNSNRNSNTKINTNSTINGLAKHWQQFAWLLAGCVAEALERRADVDNKDNLFFASPKPFLRGGDPFQQVLRAN